MSNEQLSAFAGVLLSLAFSYIPGLKDKFDSLDTVMKRLIMAGSLLIVSAGILALACFDLASSLGFTVVCDKTGVLTVVTNFVFALMANQATFTLTNVKKVTVEDSIK